MKMSGVKVDRIYVYEPEFTNLPKKQSMKSAGSSVLSKSVVDLTQRDRWNNVTTDNRKRNNKKPSSLPNSRSLCLLPQNMSSRFPLKFSNVLNIRDQELTVLGVKIIRRSITDTIKALNRLLLPLGDGISSTGRSQKLLPRYLRLVKEEFLADPGESSANGTTGNQLITSEMIKTGCLESLVNKLGHLGFEDRKEVSVLFCNLLRQQVHPYPLTNYLKTNKKILARLISGYGEESGAALMYGIMIRECLRIGALTKVFLESGQLFRLLEFVKRSRFEVSSDAFLTFSKLLTEHKRLSAAYMMKNFDEFFGSFDVLLHSDCYVTQIYSIRLLAELMHDRNNYDVMSRYVADSKKLKSIMMLMRDSSSESIQFEAFQAFKFFVGNPDPHPRICSLLMKHKENLINFMNYFQPTRGVDQYIEERIFLNTRLIEISESYPIINPKPKRTDFLVKA